MSAEERLRHVFIRSLELPETLDVSDLEYRRHEGWDSVGHMRLVAAIEQEFGIFLETAQILDFDSFKRGLEILKIHGIVDKS
ncbi:MAG: acyl carrier protein [Bdellovibrionales bacterium]